MEHRVHDIYCYYDYHKYLSDFYAEKKSSFPYFSYRYSCVQIGMAAPWLRCSAVAVKQ